MKLALIGPDDESLALVRWGVGYGHQLVAAYDVGSHAGNVQAIAPSARLGDDWESLLLGTQVDAVIVGRGMAGTSASTGIPDDERRAEQLRKLAQAAIPMLVVHPACESIIGFEVEMIRRDSRGVIVPYVPSSRHPALSELSSLISRGSDSPLGAVEQIVFERPLASRSRSAVLTAFARDAMIMRQMVGTIRSISATGPALPPGRDPLGPKLQEPLQLSNLNVHVGGEDGSSVRWSVVPAHSAEAGKITVIGQASTAVLQMPQQGQWTLHIADIPPKAWPESSERDAATSFAAFSEAIAEGGASDVAWLNACRDQEAAEAIDRSLLRGRTIELFGEDHTEEESFKGVMAMGGCLLLVMALGVLFVATIVEGLRLPLRDWVVWKFWPVYLLLPIGVFLLLQLLQLAIKREQVPSLDQLARTSASGK